MYREDSKRFLKITLGSQVLDVFPVVYAHRAELLQEAVRRRLLVGLRPDEGHDKLYNHGRQHLFLWTSFVQMMDEFPQCKNAGGGPWPGA